MNQTSSFFIPQLGLILGIVTKIENDSLQIKIFDKYVCWLNVKNIDKNILRHKLGLFKSNKNKTNVEVGTMI